MRYPHPKVKDGEIDTTSFYDISNPDSDVCSVVFLGDSTEDQSLAINGLIYLADHQQGFNPKAKNVNEIGDLNETICTIEGSWVHS